MSQSAKYLRFVVPLAMFYFSLFFFVMSAYGKNNDQQMKAFSRDFYPETTSSIQSSLL